VRFSPLYPALRDVGLLYPTIPAPLDLLTCKAYPGFATDPSDIDHHGAVGCAAQEEVPSECPRCGAHGHHDVPMVGLPGFLPGSQNKLPYTPRRRDELHPRLDPHTQRVATGDLFGYVALESGQYFIGDLWCQSEDIWQALCKLTGVVRPQTPFTLRLGKATRRGYGLVTVWIENLAPEVGPWCERTVEERVTNTRDPLTLTLLSDAILPDAWGRCRQTFDGALLQELLDTSVAIRHTFCKADHVDSFNNTLGLPRWRDVVLKAGSAVGFTITGAVDLPTLHTRIQSLEQHGIGRRRHEGFGRVAFNHSVYSSSAALRETKVPLPEPLQLAQPPNTGGAAVVRHDFEMMRSWLYRLRDDDLDPAQFREEKWTAVARWLWSAADQSVDALKDGLVNFGKPALLTDVAREPKDHFTGRAGATVNVLKTCFDEVASFPDTIRRMAIQLLAEHIAAAVDRKER
jgi:CRISPR-associated protein Csx10